MSSYLLPRQPQRGDILEIKLTITSNTMVVVSLSEQEAYGEDSPVILKLTESAETGRTTVEPVNGEVWIQDQFNNAGSYTEGASVSLRLKFEEGVILSENFVEPNEHTAWTVIKEADVDRETYNTARFVNIEGAVLDTLMYKFAG